VAHSLRVSGSHPRPRVMGRTMWFWDTRRGPWRLWGLWWKRRVFIGFSAINKGEVWDDE
jgi:hypothetical protein